MYILKVLLNLPVGFAKSIDTKRNKINIKITKQKRSQNPFHTVIKVTKLEKGQISRPKMGHVMRKRFHISTMKASAV